MVSAKLAKTKRAALLTVLRKNAARDLTAVINKSVLAGFALMCNAPMTPNAVQAKNAKTTGALTA